MENIDKNANLRDLKGVKFSETHEISHNLNFLMDL